MTQKNGTEKIGSETLNDNLDSSNARERFTADLQALSTHAQQLLEATSTVSGDGLAAVREQLQQSLRTAREHLKRLQADAIDRGQKVVEQTDSYVHENPWQAIGVGVVAGLALGIAGGSVARSLSVRN